MSQRSGRTTVGRLPCREKGRAAPRLTSAALRVPLDFLGEGPAKRENGEIFLQRPSRKSIISTLQTMMNRERKVNPMSDCIFCKLAGGEIPTNMIYQNELVACFADANPQAPVHVLVVPKCHIESADGVNESNSEAVKAVFEAVPIIAEKLGVKDNYRIINNCGEGVGQSVRHLHFHLLSGSPVMKDRLF